MSLRMTQEGSCQLIILIIPKHLQLTFAMMFNMRWVKPSNMGMIITTPMLLVVQLLLPLPVPVAER
jgi:uncharacterized protein (DUF983 family)